MDNKASNKRPHNQDSSIESSEIKRSKIEIGLLHLSDCVLTLIFEYVNTFDLYALSLTCTRFQYLIPAKKLWSRVNIRSNPMCGRKFKFFYGNLNDSTKHLMVSGVNSNEKCITNYQFQRLGKITSHLSVLAMEYQFLNSNEIQLRHFPAGLKELSLRGTQISGYYGFFQEASVRLRNLHTLVLDECKWVREHSLMALSKFSNLENLSVYKCKNLGDSVAYMSITTRFGFKKLLRIDARLTSMGDQFLKCLNNLRTIREIYLEAPIKRTRLIPRRHDLTYIALKRMLSERNDTEPPKDKINRKSTYCLEEFRPCNKIKCSFRPDVDVPKLPPDVETEVEIGIGTPEETGNVIVVSPFEMGQNDHHDVRVHVLYGNEAPFEFERQNGGRQQVEQNDSTNDNCENDCHEDPNEILYNYFNNDNDNSCLSMFYESSVSDDGIRWFTASDTNATDYLGEESILFRRPFTSTCECDASNITSNTNDDWDQPGPSGSNKQNEVAAAAPEPQPPPPQQPIERRDLRVVIERVEPGVQIIFNNNNNPMFQNNLTRLKVFVVRNFHRLTDRAMHNLSGIRLELLDVSRTGVSADAVKRFLLLNPDCRVIHESTCHCTPEPSS